MRRPGAFSTGYRRLTLGIGALAFLAAFESLAVSTVMPVAAAELGGLALYPLVFAAPLATSVVSLCVAGPWADRAGPLRIISIGCAVFSIGLLIVGAAQNIGVLITGRAIQGIGMGLISVSLYVLIARLYPAALQPAALTVLSVAWVVPGLVGPAVAGWVTDASSWRVVFLAVPVLVVPARLLVPARPGAIGPLPGIEVTRERRPRPPLAAIVAALGAGGLSVAGSRLSAGGAWVWGAVAIVSLGLVVAATVRLLPRDVLLGPDRIGPFVVSRGLLSASFALAEVYLPLQLVVRHGLSPAHAGLILTISTLTWAGGSLVAGRDVVPLRLRIPLGASAMVLGTVLTAVVLLSALSPLLAGLTWTLTGLGMGLAYTSTSILTLARSAPERTGRNSSVLQMAESIAQSSLLALAGVGFQALIARGGQASAAPYLAMFVVAIVLAALVVPLTARWQSERPAV